MSAIVPIIPIPIMTFPVTNVITTLNALSGNIVIDGSAPNTQIPDYNQDGILDITINNLLMKSTSSVLVTVTSVEALQSGNGVCLYITGIQTLDGALIVEITNGGMTITNANYNINFWIIG